MKFNITFEQFEGPLDLMLYLIKEKKLDLFDLDITVLIQQYEAFLLAMKDQSFEIATEYISELAGLIEYKSKQLIPHEKAELECECVEDPQSIVTRLLEYNAVKEVSSVLRTLYEQRAMHVSVTHALANIEVKPQYHQHSTDLVKAMQKVMLRYKLIAPYDIKTTVKELSVEDRVESILAFARDYTSFSLEQLFKTCHSLECMIVSFLAVLDCIRLHSLEYTIVDDTIYLKRSEV